MFLGNVAARGNRLQSQSILLSAIYSIRFRSEGTVPSNTLGVGVSRAVAASEFEAISGDRLSKKKKKKKEQGEQKGARSVGARTYETRELTDIVNLYFQPPSEPPSECPSRAARIMRRAHVPSSLKQQGGHIIKVTPVPSHLRLRLQRVLDPSPESRPRQRTHRCRA